MASNVIRMKVEDEEEPFDRFAAKYGRTILSVIGVLVVAAIVAIVCASVRDRKIDRGLSSVYETTYRLQADAKELEGDALDARRTAAISELAPLVNAQGIVGVRANMLAADLSYQNRNYADAVAYWEKAAGLKPKAYTANLALYNAAAAYEALGENQKAAELYKQVSEAKDFYLASHAGFNAGRVYEALSDYTAAVEQYNRILNDDPLDTWSQLGHSRVIELEARQLAGGAD